MKSIKYKQIIIFLISNFIHLSIYIKIFRTLLAIYQLVQMGQIHMAQFYCIITKGFYIFLSILHHL